MSGVAIVRSLLAANAGVIAICPAARILPGTIPLGSAMPAIGIQEVSGLERITLSRGAAFALVTERIRVTVDANTYPILKNLHNAVRLALPQTRGTVNGFTVDSIQIDAKGPEFKDSETQIESQYRDFLVRYQAASPGA